MLRGIRCRTTLAERDELHPTAPTTRAVFVLRAKDTSGDAHAFESQLLGDAERVGERVLSKLPVTS